MSDPHLFLIGYRGSGKTTVGKVLASLLNRDFVDTDVWIENFAKKPIPQIFEEDGEESFRALETAAIERMPPSPPLVVSLGGGAVLRAVNRDLLKRSGRIVWLRAEPRILAKRIAADAAKGFRRPSLTGQDPILEIETVLESREPIYRSVCDWELETANRRPSELAQDIADWYASICKS
ncbi:MAG: shikimate kinase [Planctomycetes bacterium]|nr:shikimate kinase [Planctomycetota bacterium]